MRRGYVCVDLLIDLIACVCVYWAVGGGLGKVSLVTSVSSVAQQCCNNNAENDNNNGLGALTDCLFFMQRALDLLT